MTAFWLFNTVSGLLLDEFEPVSGSWSDGINEPEEVKVTIDLGSADEVFRDWSNVATPWKFGVAVEEGGRWYGGPTMASDWDEDSQRLSITARGIWKYFSEMMFVLPPAAASTPIINPSTNLPNPALNTSFSGWDLGTIAKKLVQQACAWPGNGFPFVYQPDRVGTRERTYDAVDFKPVGDALSDLTEVINGPDIRFRLYQVDDTHLGWQLLTGTEAEPRLQSETVHYWDSAAEEPNASGVSESTNPMEMADIAFATGGRTEDTALVSRASSTALRDAGFPVLMKLDSSHSDVKVQARLDGYAAEALRTGSMPVKFRKFQARADMSPFLSEYNVGDLCRVNVEGSGYLPDGAPVRRIVGLSGDQDGEWIDVTLGEVYG